MVPFANLVTNGVLQCTQIFNVDETRKQQCFPAIKLRYTCTLTKTMYDICTHSSLPTSAILVLGLLKKKEERRKKKEMMNNFVWAAIMLLKFSGVSQVYFGSLKVATNADTTVENVYTVKSA